MGVVTLLSGQPKEGVSVEARSDLKGSYEETVTDSSGSYRLRGLHPNTSYTIRVVPFSNPSDPISRTLFCQDGDHTMSSFNTSNIKELDGSFAVPTQPINSLRHDMRMLRMDACYLELKVPSRSRRDGSCDFLDRYEHHYGDAIARPLLPSEVTANANILNDALTARNNGDAAKSDYKHGDLRWNSDVPLLTLNGTNTEVNEGRKFMNCGRWCWKIITIVDVLGSAAYVSQATKSMF
ncbi:nodal modulator 1 [Tanacetum coccineum]